MKRKERDIAIASVALIIAIMAVLFFIQYYFSSKTNTPVTDETTVISTDTGTDEFGNEYTFEYYNDEKEFGILSIYMDEDNTKKWNWESDEIELNYSIYQDDHYILSIAPIEDSGSAIASLFPVEDNDEDREDGDIQEYLAYMIKSSLNEDGTHSFEITPAILQDEYNINFE
jgi:hypothetical protein